MILNKRVQEASERALLKVKPYFEAIEERAEYNQVKVLSAFQKYKLSEAHFFGTSGYGYNDLGREVIEKIYAEIFGVEDALVRLQFVSGTHALCVGLFGILRPGDLVLSITGTPYDTLSDVIAGENIGSLKDFGVCYDEITLNDAFEVDLEKVMHYLESKKVKMVMIQRSKGYAWRKSFSAEYINSVVRKIHERFPEVVCFVDNCYGELVDKEEPYEADIIIGSLIKNLGGGIAPTGAYIVGKTKYIELIANRLTSPGVGKECGATLGFNKQILQGLFMAPHTVAQALKTVVFAAAVMEELGYEADPKSDEVRHDIIQAIKIGNPEELIRFCQGLQAGSPIDSHVTPYPWDMPGYKDQVIMAAGAFNQGASIELSADAPIREPYIVYLQGGLTFESGKYGVLKAINEMVKED
ncbi:MAG: methionine gamma-lyase family protein [Clostridia bacterium]|nr:methionine gamma-lyase family protein [Clostridia bacterium]